MVTQALRQTEVAHFFSTISTSQIETSPSNDDINLRHRLELKDSDFDGTITSDGGNDVLELVLKRFRTDYILKLLIVVEVLVLMQMN